MLKSIIREYSPKLCGGKEENGVNRKSRPGYRESYIVNRKYKTLELCIIKNLLLIIYNEDK